MVSDKQQQLVNTLKELFMMDQADLNFGIYRIMNAKHDEIESFLTNDLLSSIRQTLQSNGKTSETKKELDEAIKQAQSLGVDPDTIPKVQELKALLGNGAENSLENDENEIFSHLSTFFSRYYDGGDFMSLRRYKKETYSPLPMNGEEVKLHWANADQYYIKSAENFSQYAFKIGKENQQKLFRFELVTASTEQNNVKATEDKERRFILDETNPLAIKQTETGAELHIHFSYQADAKKRKQKDLNLAAINFLSQLEANNPLVEQIKDWSAWQSTLLTIAATDKNKTRTALEKHLNDYTAKNSFDYFIHKDLGGFLRRELDFFIKNELLLLDDLVPSSIDTLQSQLLSNERSLKKVIAFKSIAQKLIAFLAQLENFQKKLWLKKKFVQESHYCMTLDRVPESYYQEIANNDKQTQEWLSLGFTTEDTIISVDFLKENPFLLIDTALFSVEFKHNLLAEIDDLDESTDGLLIHSENFQALNLLQERYREQVKCIYIDPPYNTGGNDFAYKDSYRNSSWLTMLQDRISLMQSFMKQDGVFFSSIDDKDEDNRVTHRFMQLLENLFGSENYLDNLIWTKNTTHNDAKTFSHNHEYILAFSKNRKEAAAEHAMFRQNKPGYIQVMELVHKLQHHYPSIDEIQQAIRNLYKEQTERYKQEVLSNGLKWDKEAKRNDPWKGVKQYKYAEYRLANDCWVAETKAKDTYAIIRIYRESDPSWPNASSLTKTHRDLDNDESRFYKPLHPVTNQPCPAPARGWLWRLKPNPEKPLTQSFENLNKAHLIAYGEDENKIPQIKRFLHTVETDVVKSVITDFTDGEKELAHVIGERGTFSNPKPTSVLQKLIEITTNENDVVMDTYVGSGSTAQAILKQNFADEKKRKYLFVEMANHFDTTLLPRLKKICFSIDWKDGNPQSEEGISSFVKYLRLESYEDVLDNLQLQRTKTQADLLENPSNKALKEDYLLHYMLDIEAQDSLLSPELFISPFNATMRVVRDNESRTQSIDLVETFNYLLGLRVKTTRHSKGIVEVTGKNPQDQQILILWRDCVETDNDALDDWFKKQQYNSRDMEFDLIYVNGDNNLPNLRTGSDTWKVQLIEEIFQTLMFDVKDI